MLSPNRISAKLHPGRQLCATSSYYLMMLTGIFIFLSVGCSIKPMNPGSEQKMTEAELMAKIELNHQKFVENSYLRYHRKFPMVTREDYFEIVADKPRTFCLFQKFPVNECADFGDYEYKHGRIESAQAAYQAAVLSEDYNSAQRNVRLFGALTQLALERNDMYSAQVYISKILSINGNNKWAKSKLIGILSSK